MELWSSIREFFLSRWDAVRLFYRLHPTAERYTWVGLILISAAGTARWLATFLSLAVIGIMILFDLWGRAWRDKGRAMLDNNNDPKP